jgi:hypothetical protein
MDVAASVSFFYFCKQHPLTASTKTGNVFDARGSGIGGESVSSSGREVSTAVCPSHDVFVKLAGALLPEFLFHFRNKLTIFLPLPALCAM